MSSSPAEGVVIVPTISQQLTGAMDSVQSAANRLVTDGDSPVGTVVGGVTSAFRSASDAVSDALTFGLIPFSSRSAAAVQYTAQNMLTPPAVTPLVLDSSNEALSAFAVASAVLGTKLVFNSSFTIYHRVKRQVFLTQEDCDVFGNQEDSSDAPKPAEDDEMVERIRRMHLNDLENATPFFFLGLAYAMTKPNVTEARIVFGTFVACRIMHTVSYIRLRQQPARFGFFIGGLGINAFLAARVLYTYLT